jgi:hypothetical protein
MLINRLHTTSKGTTMLATENAHLLCQHLTKAGHHCHMPLSAGHPSLCTHHLRIAKREAIHHAESAENLSTRFTLTQEGRQRDDSTETGGNIDHESGSRHSERSEEPAETIAAALLAGADNLSTSASVNLFLGNLLRQLAHNRVSRKNAIAMAYISQLLLNSISVMQREARDAQAAAAAKAEEPQGFIINAIRPCRRLHVHESDNLSAAADIRTSDAMDHEQALKYARPDHSAPSAVVAAPFREPSLSPSLPCGERGESLDSHPTSLAPITVPHAADDKSKGCHSACPELRGERSEESAFPPAPTDKTPNDPPLDPEPTEGRTHPIAIPPPRFCEQHFVGGTFHDTPRPDTSSRRRPTPAPEIFTLSRPRALSAPRTLSTRLKQRMGRSLCMAEARMVRQRWRNVTIDYKSRRSRKQKGERR